MKDTCCILAAGGLWGMISVFIRTLQQAGFTSMQCVAIRAFFTALVLLLYVCAKDPRSLRIHLRDIPLFVGTGIFSILLFNYCYFEAIEVIGGAAVPALLMYTAPIFVMILSAVLFHERITKHKLFALVLTFVGLGFVTGAFTGGEMLSAKAVLLGLGSGFGYALYSIFGKYLVDKYSSVTITFYTFLMTSIGAIPMSDIARQLPALFSGKCMMCALGLAFFCTVLPFLLYTAGLTRVEAGKASIFATIEPFSAAIVGFFLFQEQFTVSKVAGMLCIFFAIVYLNVSADFMPFAHKSKEI